MTYKHILNKDDFSHAAGKIVCVGRNYAEHAKELNNPIPSQPILFIKPATSAVPFSPQIAIPTQFGSCHHELEIAILIGKTLSSTSEDNILESIAGIGLGLDLTLRDVQQTLKDKGHPWERAKSFDGACPLSPFISLPEGIDLQNIDLTLTINQQVRQKGNSRDMLFPILPLITEISQWFTLNPGDVVMTGTPSGVGALNVGDQLEAKLGSLLQINSTIVAR